MSLVFVKSRDKQASEGRYNPNSPFRFSNYITQPLQLPPDSQVCYVGSTFNIDTNGILDEGTMRLLQGIPEMDYPQPIISYENIRQGSWTNVLNSVIQGANEYGLNDMFINHTTNTIDINGSINKNNPTGYNFWYDESLDKVEINCKQNTGIDSFNLDFNSLSDNPTLNFSSIGGGVYPAKINFGNNVDVKFQSDSKQVKSSKNVARLDTGTSVGGLVLDTETNPTNALTNLYAGGSNYYNTGWSCNSLLTNDTYDFTQPGGPPLPPFNQQKYAGIMTNVGIRRVIGNVTPSTSIQTSNTGGHQYIGHLQSGGYALWTQSNISQTKADAHYDTTYNSTKQGFTGFAPQFVGVQSLPFIYSHEGNSIEEKFSEFLGSCDLNDSYRSTIAEDAEARYLFGIRIEDVGTPGNKDIQVQAEMLDPDSTLTRSSYIELEQPLSILKLSKGINSVANDYEFEPGAQYHIQISDASTGDTEIPDPATDDVLLNNATNGTLVQLTNNTRFRDIGGDGNYTSGNSYDIVFDAGQTTEGIDRTAQIKFNSFGFEHTESQMYDRLGIEGSSDGVNFFNVSIAGLHTSANATVPWSTSFGGGGTANNSSPGYILPKNEAQYASNGGASLDTIIETEYRYLRFTFRSDGASNDEGWDITLSTSPEKTIEAPGSIVSTMLFFRWRWINPYQMAIEYTLSVPGFLGSYNNATDLPYAPGVSPAAVPGVESDPRDKWCVLATMNLGVSDNIDYMIPTYMGDMCLVQYPIASRNNTGTPFTDFMSCTKGYYNVRMTNRYYSENNTSIAKTLYGDPLQDATFFNFDKLNNASIMIFDYLNPSDPDKTTPIFDNGSGILEFNKTFTITGIYDYNIGISDRLYLLSVELLKVGDERTMLKQDQNTPGGEPLFRQYHPDGLEMGYQLGYLTPSDSSSIVRGTIDPDTKVNKFIAPNEITNNSRAFSLHVQLTNLPIQSQNGVVSSQNKTIYVINSLCINKSIDASTYRFYCDEAPHPIWIDLNNKQPINLNKFEVLITDDENKPQKLMINDTDLTLQFRVKPGSDTSLS